jgi:hypothetical protein
MLDNVGMQAAHDAQVVGDGAQMRKEFADLEA